MLSLKIDWKDIFFPILKDIKEINEETEANKIGLNNLELSKNKEKYLQVLKEIEEIQKVSIDHLVETADKTSK